MPVYGDEGENRDPTILRTGSRCAFDVQDRTRTLYNCDIAIKYNVTKSQALMLENMAMNENECISLYHLVQRTPFKLPALAPASIEEYWICESNSRALPPSDFVFGKTAYGDVPLQFRGWLLNTRLKSSNTGGFYRFEDMLLNSVSMRSLAKGHRYHSSSSIEFGGLDLVPRSQNSKAGIRREDKFFLNIRKETPDEITLKRVRRIINPNFPWLAAQPDLVAFKNNEPFKIIEMKTTRDVQDEEAHTGQKLFYFSHEGIQLNPETDVWYQVQVTMAASNVQECDVHVWFTSNRKWIRVNVVRDDDAVLRILTELQEHYFYECLPFLASYC